MIEEGPEVFLVNARATKNLLGRKMGVQDLTRTWELLSCLDWKIKGKPVPAAASVFDSSP
jgi:hypothetical protein